MNTMDANPHSMAEKKEKKMNVLVVLLQFTNYLATNATVLFAIRGETGKSVFKD